MMRGLTETLFRMLRALRLAPLQMPSKKQCLDETDFNRLISYCPDLESLELENGYQITNRSTIHLLVTCPKLAHFVFASTWMPGWIDALDMGYGENLHSIKIYEKQSKHEYSCSEQDFQLDDFSFHPFVLRKLESISLESGCSEYVEAHFSRPQLPALRSLRILHPSNAVLYILSQRLAAQLTIFKTKLNERTDPKIYRAFSRKTTSLQSLDCSPNPVMGLLGRNITTLSANSSLRLLDSIAELCPNLESLTLWGGSISRDPCHRIRSDPQMGMIYVIEMCPIKRVRLVNAYLGLGSQFWQTCGEFGKGLEILDIELLDCKGMNSWGMFEGLRDCERLQWLRLTELLGVRKEVIISCLEDLKRLCALYLSIPDMETGCFSISMEEIVSLLSSFRELSEVHLIVPKPCPNSATTTPRSSLDMGEQEKKQCFKLPLARAEPTMVFKNAFNQNIYGRVEWSVPGLGYY
ncbi:hypothetical protein BC939DRAFT_478709 [Gamsiella multidivaricata]|uniref:uncharacterized protein n=1 Tax=Gamsiella multidivaricata TaxID=101098 RepID=UPI00221FCF38|nr:uncharacterized protein BC939DRAFT_478709 [Gamsiella multidivaricata]KAG0366724.1 hypothetical protein BGZ54_004960 [Gamsiella multidivaricata]KAI7820842.1 hypothetical protein BC939DRAFT_478709 [Gamsiella multidivaricata]